MNKKSVYLVLALIFIDWLDFSLYLYLAKPIITPAFFGTMNNGLLLSFAIFSASYLARPIGGYFFGRLADKKGRRGPLINAAFLMGIATLGICFIPEYKDIGLFATAGLLFFRTAQGIALGGEVHTSSMFLIEHHPNQKVLMGSFVAMASALGMFVGALCATLATLEGIALSWRGLFLGVGILSLAICYLRKTLVESPEFEQKPNHTTSLWPTYKAQILKLLLLSVFVSAMVYISNVFWVSFAMSHHLLENFACTWIGSLAQLFSALLAYPIAKRTTFEYAPKKLIMCMLIMMISAPLQFYFTAHHALYLTLTTLLFYVLANGLLCASLYTVLYQLLPVQYRCQWLSTLWSLGASAGALSLPLLQWFTQNGHDLAPGLLLSGVAMMSGLYFLTDEYRKEKWYREEDSSLPQYLTPRDI